MNPTIKIGEMPTLVLYAWIFSSPKTEWAGRGTLAYPREKSSRGFHFIGLKTEFHLKKALQRFDILATLPTRPDLLSLFRISHKEAI
jgi:hypothetical protein